MSQGYNAVGGARIYGDGMTEQVSTCCESVYRYWHTVPHGRFVTKLGLGLKGVSVDTKFDLASGGRRLFNLERPVSDCWFLCRIRPVNMSTQAITPAAVCLKSKNLGLSNHLSWKVVLGTPRSRLRCDLIRTVDTGRFQRSSRSAGLIVGTSLRRFP